MSNSKKPDPWPRQLPVGWTIVRVAEAGAVRLGRQRSPDQMSGEFPTRYIRAANITPSGLNLNDLFEMNFTPSERDVFALKAGDVLLTEASGSASQVGRAAVWRGGVEPCCYQNTVIRFRPHLVTPEYALLVFRHMAANGMFARASKGVGIQHLGASRFAELRLPLPPLPEQVRIVTVAERRLADIREAHNRLRSALKNLEEQVREVLAAAIAGEFVERQAMAPNEVQIAAPPSTSGQAGFFDDLDLPLDLGLDSALPEGWHWSRVDHVGTAALGRQRSPQYELGPNMRPYLRVANVLEDKIDLSDLKEMNFSFAEESKYRLKSGDILLNEGQSPELVGRPAIYRGELDELYYQNHLIRFRTTENILPDFALLVFRHYLHAGIFRRIARWSTNIANMGLERFKALPFPVPPLVEQASIVLEARSRLEIIDQQTEAVLASLERLPSLEQELLAVATAGELVPQNPDDEPAAALKARLGSPDQPSPAASKPKSRGLSMPSKRPRPSQQAEPKPDLAAVLRENGRALRVSDLFALAGYDRDLPEHVELFYLALRSVLNGAVRVVEDGSFENAKVELTSAT